MFIIITLLNAICSNSVPEIISEKRSMVQLPQRSFREASILSSTKRSTVNPHMAEPP